MTEEITTPTNQNGLNDTSLTRASEILEISADLLRATQNSGTFLVWLNGQNGFRAIVESLWTAPSADCLAAAELKAERAARKAISMATTPEEVFEAVDALSQTSRFGNIILEEAFSRWRSIEQLSEDRFDIFSLLLFYGKLLPSNLGYWERLAKEMLALSRHWRAMIYLAPLVSSDFIRSALWERANQLIHESVSQAEDIDFVLSMFNDTLGTPLNDAQLACLEKAFRLSSSDESILLDLFTHCTSARHRYYLARLIALKIIDIYRKK